MAKKTTAKGTTKKPKQPKRDYDAEAKAIFAECETAATNQLATYGKTWTRNALLEVKTKFTASIKKRLKRGGDWKKEGPKVLFVSTAMADVANILSHTDTSVNQKVANAAFKAVTAHVGCPVRPGSGAWCEGV